MVIFKNKIMTIAEIFKKVREEAGLSQVMVAEMIGSTQGTISNIEKSVNSNPSYDIVSKYISVVGANPVFLFGIDPEAPPIVHPEVMKIRMAGGTSKKIQKDIIKDIERSLEKLKSL